MNRKLIIYFFLALLWACSGYKQTVSHFKIFSSHPEWERNTNGYKIDSLDIYYYKNLIMYKMPIQNIDLDAPPLDSSKLNSTLTYYYVVHREGNKDGLSFGEDFLKHNYPINIDSFLHQDSRLSFDSLHLQLKKKYQLANNSTDTIEKYIPINKKNDSYSDTNFYFFKKEYNNFKFSLSPSLDKEKRTKLYKFIALFNGQQNNDTPTLRQSWEWSFWFTKEHNEENRHIVRIFNQFEAFNKEM